MTAEWTNFFLLGSLFYIVYLQYKIDKAEEELEYLQETMLAMAQELQSLGSPNVRMQHVPPE
jgi:hypothetical protein